MRSYASSENAKLALEQVSILQEHFVTGLSKLSTGTQFQGIEWLRDGGKHGGGLRYQALNNDIFNRVQVNVSQIHFPLASGKKIVSATALSTIVHPQHPILPSVHIHVSWTELNNGQQYWRIMADLNPSIINNDDKIHFCNTLKKSSGDNFSSAIAQGDDYFYIPALKKHRGICHFYLEGFKENTANKGISIQIARNSIDSYLQILSEKLHYIAPPTDQEIQQQLAYHTLYFYQVLTLDKGTTAGILTHNQNDIGTLGSLPAYIVRELLEQWVELTPSPNQQLLTSILSGLPSNKLIHIDDQIKQTLADILRSHYQNHRLPY